MPDQTGSTSAVITDAESMAQEVKARQDAAFKNAETYTTAMTTFLEQTQTLVSELRIQPLDAVDYIESPDIDDLDSWGSFPSTIGIEDPSMPETTLGTIPGVHQPVFGTSPTFTDTAPEVTYGLRPDKPVVPVPTSPVLEDIDVPDYDVDDSVEAFPEIDWDSIIIPEKPQIELIPMYDATLDAAPAQFDQTFSWNEDAYALELANAIKVRVLDTLANGGIGLNDEWETALFSRSRARQVDAARRSLLEIDDEFAAQGWPAPSGARDASLNRKLNEFMWTEQDIIDKIMQVQVEHGRKNYEFHVTQGIAVDDLLSRHFNMVQERALRAAMAVFELGVSKYQQIIANYNLRVLEYKTKAEVFEAKVRANLSILEQYRLELQGTELDANIKMKRIDEYNAKLGAIKMMVDIYGEKVKAAAVHADIEKTKIAIFSEEIRAYGAQIEAYATEMNAWKTEVEASKTPLDVYRAKVDAFSSRVSAYRGTIDAEAAKTAASLEVQRSVFEAHRAKIANAEIYLRGYLAKVDVRKTEFDSEVTKFTLQLNREIESIRLQAEEARLRTQVEERNLALQTERAKEELRHYEAIMGLSFSGVKSGADIAAAATTAAFASINFIMESSVQALRADTTAPTT